MEQNDLLKILQGDISHINNVNERGVGLYDMRVIVTPVDVKKMLPDYLSGKLSSDDLTDGAGFLCIRTEHYRMLSRRIKHILKL